MPLDLLLSAVGLMIVMSVTPGPNNLMVMASSANFGVRRTLPHIAGISFGVMVMLAGVGLGVAQLLALYPPLYQGLRVISLAYMGWLAWRLASSGGWGLAGGDSQRPMSFLQACLFQWVNPKAWAFMLTLSTAYTIPDAYLQCIFILAVLLPLFGIPSNLLWAGFGTLLRRLLGQPKHLRIFNVVMALLLLASISPVLIDLI